MRSSPPLIKSKVLHEDYFKNKPISKGSEMIVKLVEDNGNKMADALSRPTKVWDGRKLGQIRFCQFLVFLHNVFI